MIDFVLHFDAHLAEFVVTYGIWVYALLFAIVRVLSPEEQRRS